MARKWCVNSGRRSSKLMACGLAVGGALDAAQTADAAIIYSSANQTLNTTGNIALDLNQDNINEGTFNLTNVLVNPDNPLTNVNLTFNSNTSTNTNLLVNNGVLNPLVLNETIGPDGNFLNNNDPASNLNNYELATNVLTNNTNSGPFAGVRGGYLGFEFDIRDSVHYGWARISFLRNTFILQDYAYEDVAGMEIGAGEGSPVPEPASLGMLALGAVGVLGWRRARAKSSDAA
jgi:hypothetical protein